MIIKKCPCCNSTRIKGAIEIRNDKYIQNIQCKRCGYVNKRIIGEAFKEA